MGLKSHFEMMAKYNHWFNGKIDDSASSLSEEILNKDQGAFFKSISGEPTISNSGLLYKPQVGSQAELDICSSRGKDLLD